MGKYSKIEIIQNPLLNVSQRLMDSGSHASSGMTAIKDKLSKYI
jgi:hypothetical protein